MANNSNNLSKLSKIAGSSSNNNVVTEPVNEIKPAEVDTNKYKEYVESHPIDNDVDIEVLVKDFVGCKYEIFKNSLFNIPAFLFTSLYMFYRKMFLYGFLSFIISFIILNYFHSFLIKLVFNVVVGLVINKVYLAFARSKCAKIKVNNPKKNIPYLEVLCSSAGGTSMGALIVGILFEFIVAVIVSAIMVLVGIAGVLSKLLNF